MNSHTPSYPFFPFLSVFSECSWRNSWVGGCHACWDFPFHY